jgi:hypothetical protein
MAAARPCRRALRLMRFFASAVRGPVLRCEFCRLAAILRSDGIAKGAGLHALLCSNARRLDPSIQYFIRCRAQASAHVIASELNFPQNSVSAEFR